MLRSTWPGPLCSLQQPMGPSGLLGTATLSLLFSPCATGQPVPHYVLTLLTGVFAAQIILLVVALVALLALCRTTDAQGAALELSGNPRALLRRGADDGPSHDKNDDKGGKNGGRHLLGRCTTDQQCDPRKKCVLGRCEDNIDNNNNGH